MKKEKIGDVEVTPDYWDCDCYENNVHPESETECERCGCKAEEMSNSTVAEVEESLKEEKTETKKLSRSDWFEEAVGKISDALTVITYLKNELQVCKDNMSANLRESDEGNRLEEARDALEGIETQLEEAENLTIEFPGMFG